MGTKTNTQCTEKNILTSDGQPAGRDNHCWIQVSFLFSFDSLCRDDKLLRTSLAHFLRDSPLLAAVQTCCPALVRMAAYSKAKKTGMLRRTGTLQIRTRNGVTGWIAAGEGTYEDACGTGDAAKNRVGYCGDGTCVAQGTYTWNP